MKTETRARTVHALAAFRACDARRHDHGISYEAVMEWTGPDAVRRVLQAAEDNGIWCSLRDDDDYHHDLCYAVLDLCDERGDVVRDQCIPTRAAWDWWVRAVELRADSSDCPVDEPAAYSRTYAAS